MARPQIINKEIILENAIKLLETNNIENFSMRKLSTMCNVGTSTIYIHYKNKLEIIIAIFQKFWRDCFKGFQFADSLDFFLSIKKFYFHILEHLDIFKISLLSMFTNMSPEDKSIGKEEMGFHILKLKKFIENCIISHIDDFDSEFLKKIELNYLISFIFENLKDMLMRNEREYVQFEIILKKLLLAQ